jgi:hypothetical protein
MTREWDSPESGRAWIARVENLDRAAWAEAAVQAFRDVCSGDMDETALTDLVANMGHLADRLTAELEDFALSFEGMVAEARRHYEAEIGEGDGFG